MPSVEVCSAIAAKWTVVYSSPLHMHFKISIFYASPLCAIGLATVLLCACVGADSNTPSATAAPGAKLLAANADTFSGTISIDLASAGVPVNTALLGNNSQWVDNGDGLVSDTGQAQMQAITSAAQMQPSVLRYPGGSLSDTYHWRDGIGAVESRGSNRDLANHYQRVNFGTDEFLQLASYLNSAPLVTVNLVTGDAQEAADWVRYANGSGATTQQRVKYWELGNEPYLQENARPDLALAPAEFARRANAAILAMKAIDPSIQVGIPLRSDTIGGIAATPYPGFNSTVLSQITAPIDYVAVHNGYFPFVFTASPVTDQDLYAAVMAASGVLSADLDATRAQLHALRPEQALPIALTEYNALFGLGTSQLIEYSNSLAGALYVADTLNLLVARTDILAANIWSLLGNGSFGVMDNSGLPRPTYYVLQAYKKLFQGNRLAAQLSAPSVASATVGAVPAAYTPAISATVTRDAKTLRIAVINRHSTAAANVSLELANGSAAPGGAYSVLNGGDLFAGANNHAPISWTSGTVVASGNQLALTLPAHSLTVYEIPLTRTTPLSISWMALRAIGLLRPMLGTSKGVVSSCTTMDPCPLALR